MKLKSPPQWIKINKSENMPSEKPFLLSDKFGSIHVGYTAFDYYEAEYWFPIPEYPMDDRVITNDQCISRLLSQDDK